MSTIDEKIEYIKEVLANADEYTVEQVYEFLLENEYWRKVIGISNPTDGGAAQERMRSYIAEALASLPPDVLQMIYNIIFCAESGLE